MKKKLIRIWALSGLLSLAGCLAAGVPHSSDPNDLLRDAYEMMRQGRPLPAKKFIGDALEKFQAQGNEIGMAAAYSAYGNFYKNGALGLQRYEESEENFRKALALYEKNANDAGIVKSHFGIGNAYHSRDTVKECAEYRVSLEKYQEGLKRDPDLDRKIGLSNPNYKTVGDMILDFINGFCKKPN